MVCEVNEKLGVSTLKAGTTNEEAGLVVLGLFSTNVAPVFIPLNENAGVTLLTSLVLVPRLKAVLRPTLKMGFVSVVLAIDCDVGSDFIIEEPNEKAVLGLSGASTSELLNSDLTTLESAETNDVSKATLVFGKDFGVSADAGCKFESATVVLAFTD